MNRLIQCGFPIMLALSVWGSAGTNSALADEIEVGQSRDDVIAALGEPQGTGLMGDTEVMFYSRGSVTIRDGEVIESSVISQAALERREAQWKKDEAARRERQEAQRQQRIAKGTKEKARMLADEAFAKQPARQQAQAWRRFNRTYPEVAATQELRAAEARAREEDLAKREATLAAAEEAAPPSTLNRRKRKKWARSGTRRNNALAEELGLSR